MDIRLSVLGTHLGRSDYVPERGFDRYRPAVVKRQFGIAIAIPISLSQRFAASRRAAGLAPDQS